MGIVDQWRGYIERKNTRRQKEAALADWIEHMVRESDPSIRTVSGYQRRLRKPVAHAVAYFERLSTAIPGPVNLSAALWEKDPLIHALFVGPDEIRSLLRQHAELSSFFRTSGEKEAVALVTATKTERTVFAAALKGELIQRDVARTAVEFKDHRVVSPVATEAESRHAMVQRGLNLLASVTLEQSMESHALRDELAGQRRSLQVKLRILQAQERGMEHLLGGGDPMQEEAEEAQRLLQELDQQIGALNPETGSPHDVLAKLEGVLTSAENFLLQKTVRMRLDWMGIKIEADSPENGREITLTELEIPDRLKRVVLLSRIQAGECL